LPSYTQSTEIDSSEIFFTLLPFLNLITLCIVALYSIIKIKVVSKGVSSKMSLKESNINNYIPKIPKIIDCRIEKTLNVIGGKWSFYVLRELFDGIKRFGELQRQINGVSPKALTDTLRHLEIQGVLEREAFATVPVTVQYKLTPKGEDLHQILIEMKLWAAKWA
jgi:DNA-binding HxlR family transcriptional regulator